MTTGMSTAWIIILGALIVLFLVAGLWAFRTPRHKAEEAKRQLGVEPEGEAPNETDETDD